MEELVEFREGIHEMISNADGMFRIINYQNLFKQEK